MGDPACWLNRVCPECGAFNEDSDQPCWRCGAALPEPPADGGGGGPRKPADRRAPAPVEDRTGEPLGC